MGLTVWLFETAVHLIEVGGYWGVFFGLVIDSCGLPIPSEVILALSGSIARTTGQFSLLPLIIIGTIAQTIGAYISYLIGRYGGEPLVKKYGKYVLISSHDYDKAKRWFEKYGERTIIISRCVPVIRTYIGFPAGTFEMNQRKFVIDTFIGSAIWTVFLVMAGYLLGDKWHSLYKIMHLLDYVIIILLAYFIGRFIYKKVKRRNAATADKAH